MLLIYIFYLILIALKGEEKIKNTRNYLELCVIYLYRTINYLLILVIILANI